MEHGSLVHPETIRFLKITELLSKEDRNRVHEWCIAKGIQSKPFGLWTDEEWFEFRLTF